MKMSFSPEHARKPRPQFHFGFSLLEVVMAVGIFAFVGVGLISLFSLGLDASRDSAEKLLSANIAASLIDTRRAAPTVDMGSNFPVPMLNEDADNKASPILLDQDGKPTTDPTVARIKLVYQILGPNAAAGRNGFSQLYLRFSWPAGSPTTSANGAFEIATSIALK